MSNLIQNVIWIITNYPVFKAALQMPLSKETSLLTLSGICNAARNKVEFAIQQN